MTSRKGGMALVAALVAAFLAASMILVVMMGSQSNNELAQVSRHRAQARYMSEGALASASSALQTAVANWKPVPTTGTISLNNQAVNFAVVPTGLSTISTDSAGIQTLVDGYEITAMGQSERSQEPLRKIVNVLATPIFQFAVFYTEDLEIFPGPDMTLGGRVHSNGDMYLGCGSDLTLDTNYVGAAGKIYRERKDAPGTSDGSVHIRKWVENPYDVSEPEEFFDMFSKSQMASQGVTTASGFDSAFTSGLDLNADGDFNDTGDWLPWGPGALDFWGQPDGYLGGTGHTVLNDAHGVGVAAVPNTGSIAMFEESDGGSYEFDSASNEYIEVGAGLGTHDKGFFYENADLSIITYDNGSWDAFDSSGASVKASLLSAVTTTTLFDARQANGSSTKTPVTTIDIQALNASGVFPLNGLIYAAHYGMGQGTQAKGVMLKNGSELHGPLTVVTEGAMYVQGDYNVTNKKGASVIGDAVNLLSNSWSGTKTVGTLPTASKTTFNMAMVTGTHATTAGHYNGGLENLPRFHENWSGIDCNIVGSFVCMWMSQFATGAWKYGGDRYTAPGRKWAYDEAFNQVANLPPFTPMAVTAEDVVTW